MIAEEKINGMIFVAQTTYYIYRDEADRIKDEYVLCTSNTDNFISNKDEARKNERINADNKFVVI